MSKNNITLERYNEIIFRRIINALYQEWGLAMAGKDRPGSYTGHAYNNTRTIIYKFTGLTPRQIETIRKNQTLMTRYVRTGEKRPVRLSEPGGGILHLEVPKLGRHWEQVTVQSLEARRYLRPGSLKMAFGLGHQDRPMVMDFTRPHSSTLGVFGMTQSGKTNTVRLLVWEAMMSRTADVILADVGLREKNFGVFAGAAALAHPLIIEPKDAFSLLVWLKAEIIRRANNPHEERKPLFVVIDEVQTFIDQTEPYGDSSKLLSDLTRQCIQVGIKLIVSTQQAQIQLIGQCLNNLRLRVCHKVDRATTGTQALGIKNAGAEGLLGYGDCLYKNDEGLHRMSVARLDEKRDADQYDRIERGPERRIAGIGKTTVESVAPNIQVKEIHSSQSPDPIEMGQLASVIFKPIGVKRIKERFKVGSRKAKELRNGAQEIRAYAYHNNYTALPEPDEEVITAVKNQGYNWLSNDWTEI